MARTKTAASWSNVKAGFRDFDRTALLGVLQDLYAASKENQAFLHARLNLGGNPRALQGGDIALDMPACSAISLFGGESQEGVSDYRKAMGIQRVWRNSRRSIARR